MKRQKRPLFLHLQLVQTPKMHHSDPLQALQTPKMHHSDPLQALQAPKMHHSAPLQTPQTPKNTPCKLSCILKQPKKPAYQDLAPQNHEKIWWWRSASGVLVLVFCDFHRLLALSKDRKRISLALLFSLELKRLLLNGLSCSFRRRKIWFFIYWLVWCYRWWLLGYTSPLQSPLWSLWTKVLLVSWTIGRGSA